MIKFIQTKGFPSLLLIIGFLLMIIGFFEISDITKLAIEAKNDPNYVFFGLGFVFILSAIALFVFDKRLANPSLPDDLNANPAQLTDSVFISAPMNSFVIKGRPDDYKESRSQILKIVNAIKLHCEIKDVYYAGENIKDPSDFDLPGSSLKDDFRRIQEREYFVLIWNDKFASRSALLEAGIALTLNKKCIYFVKNPDDLPFLLQGAPNVTRTVKVIKYKDESDLIHKIETTKSQMFDFVPI